MAAKPGERPVECAHEPRHAGLFARQGRAAPLIAAVKEPDARKWERCRDFLYLSHVMRARTTQPVARHRINGRKQSSRRTRQPRNALVAQGARPFAAFD